MRTVHLEIRPQPSLLLLLVQPGEQVGHRRAAVQTRRGPVPRQPKRHDRGADHPLRMLECVLDRFQHCVHPGVHVLDLHEPEVGDEEPEVVPGRLEDGQRLLDGRRQLLDGALGLEIRADAALVDPGAELGGQVAGGRRSRDDRACVGERILHPARLKEGVHEVGHERAVDLGGGEERVSPLEQVDGCR